MGISRRSALIGGAAMAGLASRVGDLVAATSRRPNILFILADDMGFADLGCYGSRVNRTPRIDALAAEGVRFTQALSNSPTCSPTRTALATGRYQYRLPLGLEEPLQNPRLGLPPDHPSLPSLLRDAGYRTALIGKWHLGKPPLFGPRKSGYDYFWGILGGEVDYFQHNGIEGHDLWENESPVSADGYLTDLIADKSIAQLSSYAGKPDPFFLSVHFTAPHWPWEGPDDRAESDRLAAAGRRALPHFDGGSLETYARIVGALDRQVGRILDTLDTLGLAKDTLVIFTSDNGGERFSDNWPFTGMKTQLLEGGLRVPAIVRWPGIARPGSVSGQMCMTMDWLPTLVSAGGGSPDRRFPPDGMDLTAQIAGASPVNRTLFWRAAHKSQAACRSGDYKYLKIGENEFLFDLARDQRERANLKARMPDLFDRLRASWLQWNDTMLPIDPGAFVAGFNGAVLADQ